MNKNDVREKGIKARNGLSPDERKNFSVKIADRILGSDEFKNSKTVMLYRAIGCEVSLSPLEDASSEAMEKLFAYPYCIDSTEMAALIPEGKDSWKKGRFGIEEPLPEKSKHIDPLEIDLVICPCTAFDERGQRIGMGAGYYDRFLKKCKNAAVIAAAFECQKAEIVPAEKHDIKMKKVFTECAEYEAL